MTGPSPQNVAATLVEAEAYHPLGPRVKSDGVAMISLTRYPIHVLFTFAPGVDRQAVEAQLQIEGPAPTVQRWDGNALYFQLPDDQNGPWQFRLPRVTYKGQQGFTLQVRRVRENMAKVTVMGQVMDSPAQPSSPTGQQWDISGTFARGLPLKPVELVVEFGYPVHRESVEQVICDRIAATTATPVASLGIRFDWRSDRQVTVTVPPLASEVVVNWTGARDQEGLALWTAGYTLVFNGGRRLLAVDPATGKSEVLHTFERVFDTAVLSPDRRRLAVITPPTREADYKVWIVDLQSGLWQDTGKRTADPRQLAWVSNEQLEVHDPPVSYRHLKESPDGRWLAEVTLAPAPAQPADGPRQPLPLPGFLTVTDQVSGAVQRYPLHVAPSKYCCTMPSLVWSTDGRHLAFFDLQNPQRQLLALDVETGTLQTLAATDRLPGSPWAPSGWSPDGNSLAYEGLLIRNGQVEVLESAWSYAYPWSPDGRFLLYTAAGRDAGIDSLWVYDLARGEKRVIGQGVLIGWLEDGRALINEGATPNGFQPPGI